MILYDTPQIHVLWDIAVWISKVLMENVKICTTFEFVNVMVRQLFSTELPLL